MTEPHTDLQSTGTYTVGPSNVATQLVSAGDYSTLVTNLSLTTVVYLGQHNAIKINDPDVVPLNPNASIVFDGSIDIFGTAAVNTQVAVVASGAASFLGLTQAQGTLVLPSIQSQNYVPGVSGWAIFANGNAEFNGITARGNIVFSDGFLSNGDGTFTNQPGLFLYSGTPAVGNLIYSNTNTVGTDKFGNAFQAGETSYDNTNRIALQIFDGTITASSFTAQPGATFTQTTNLTFLSNGQLSLQTGVIGGPVANLFVSSDFSFRVFDNGDLQTYATEHLYTRNVGIVSVNSTTPVTVISLTVSGPRFYSIRGTLRFVASAAGTVVPITMRLGGTATFSTIQVRVKSFLEAQSQTISQGLITAAGADPSVVIPNVPNSATGYIEFEGLVQVTAGGTLLIQAREVVGGGESFNIFANSTVDIAPI